MKQQQQYHNSHRIFQFCFSCIKVMHEYLQMRLETKPVTPNPLSLEQLMKELREGLILAMTHRERFNKHIHTAFHDNDNELEKYTILLDNFDTTVKKTLDVSEMSFNLGIFYV